MTFSSEENEIVYIENPEETAEILQFLNPEIVKMNQKFYGYRNCKNGDISSCSSSQIQLNWDSPIISLKPATHPPHPPRECYFQFTQKYEIQYAS